MVVSKRMFVAWYRKKIADPVSQILTRGTEPKQLAFSTALGFTIGVFPICGVTVILCGMALALFGSRCHAPSLMLANFVATPIEISLLVPFLRFGEALTGGSHFPLTSDALRKVLAGQASLEIVLAIGRAMLGWLVFAPFAMAIIYFLSLPCFNILVRKFGAGSTSPKKSALGEVRVKVRDLKFSKQ